jgi:hypothetical protein
LIELLPVVSHVHVAGAPLSRLKVKDGLSLQEEEDDVIILEEEIMEVAAVLLLDS